MQQCVLFGEHFFYFSFFVVDGEQNKVSVSTRCLHKLGWRDETLERRVE